MTSIDKEQLKLFKSKVIDTSLIHPRECLICGSYRASDFQSSRSKVCISCKDKRTTSYPNDGLNYYVLCEECCSIVVCKNKLTASKTRWCINCIKERRNAKKTK